MRYRVKVVRLYAIGVVWAVMFAAVLWAAADVWAQNKSEKVFSAIITDAGDIETEVKNLLFYWEEKISDTAFVPHELKQVPVKRGTATVNVKFDQIKFIDVKSAADHGLPLLTITLANGKTGEFALAIPGRFKGESDFGEVEFPANGVKKISFKP
jgi:hypothetical protein